MAMADASLIRGIVVTHLYAGKHDGSVDHA